MKEERALMTRFIIGSTKRLEMDLQNYLGSYEFSVVPRSIFSSDGQLLLASDKATIIHQVETLVQSSIENYRQIEGVNTGHVILFDSMAVVHRLRLGSSIINYEQFADTFFRIIQEESSHAEVKVVFDRYIDHSLKGSTREKRRMYTPAQDEVQDDTSLKNLTLKTFLSHILTKQDLTVYLGKKLAKKFTKEQIAFAVSFNGTTVTNIRSTDPQLLENNREEAYTLLILHTFDVAKQNPFHQLKVVSPDTDVFLLLLAHYYPGLPVLTSFVTGRGSTKRAIDIRMTYETLGADKSAALLGFHAFAGCDQTSKFCGKSTLTC